MYTVSKQSMLSLFEPCCELHDESHCDVDCFHGVGKDACPCSQRIVCCKECPHYHYTKQTREQNRRERIAIAESFGCTLKEAGYHYA